VTAFETIFSAWRVGSEISLLWLEMNNSNGLLQQFIFTTNPVKLRTFVRNGAFVGVNEEKLIDVTSLNL